MNSRLQELLANSLVSPNYQKDLPSSIWVLMEEIPVEDDYFTDTTSRTIQVKICTKEPVLDPAIKYFPQPIIMEGSFAIAFSKIENIWICFIDGDFRKDGIVPHSYILRYVDQKNRHEKKAITFRWKTKKWLISLIIKMSKQPISKKCNLNFLPLPYKYR